MLILILIFLIQNSNITVCAAETTSVYARIMFEQVYLYKTPTDDNSISNVYFELPKTYFVELLGKSGNFYEAKYMNLTGYVKKDSVQAVSGTPIHPNLDNVTFRVYAELSQTIWSAPTTQENSTALIQVPSLTKNILYIGKINVECLIEGRTNTWFYCRFTNFGTNYYGYVYSDFCDEISQIISNNEELTYINNPTFEPFIEQPPTIPQNSNIVGVIVGILSIPALIFMFMIMKSSKILNQEKPKRKEIIDY